MSYRKIPSIDDACYMPCAYMLLKTDWLDVTWIRYDGPYIDDYNVMIHGRYDLGCYLMITYIKCPSSLLLLNDVLKKYWGCTDYL